MCMCVCVCVCVCRVWCGHKKCIGPSTILFLIGTIHHTITHTPTPVCKPILAHQNVATHTRTFVFLIQDCLHPTRIPIHTHSTTHTLSPHCLHRPPASPCSSLLCRRRASAAPARFAGAHFVPPTLTRCGRTASKGMSIVKRRREAMARRHWCKGCAGKSMCVCMCVCGVVCVCVHVYVYMWVYVFM